MLLLALMFYLYYEAPPEEQNFPMVMEMIRAGDVREDVEDFISPTMSASSKRSKTVPSIPLKATPATPAAKNPTPSAITKSMGTARFYLDNNSTHKYSG